MTKTTPCAPRIPLPQAARGEISSLLAILDAFGHRNKNQHRLSPWWSRFSTLRRALRTLSREKNVAGVGSGVGAGAALVPRANVVWLRDPVIPRCYVSFSQLAADNQYATLGLMLLVVIARVNTILNNLLPTEEPTPTRPAIEPPIKNASISKPIGGDKGVKVQRDGTEDTPATTQSAEQALKRGPLPVEVPKKKRKKKSKDEFSSLFGSLA